MKKIAIGSLFGLGLVSGSASAAVDASVTTALTTAATDVATIGAAVILVILGAMIFKYLRRVF